MTLDSIGNIYGTTTQGGDSNVGTVYKIATGTNTITTLVSFSVGPGGAFPYAGVTLDSSGNIYGTTVQGGIYRTRVNNDFISNGTVYKVAAGTNEITTLASFSGGENGFSPVAGVTLDSSGNIYGTTEQGGSNNNGTVYKIAAGTDTVTTVASFDGVVNSSYVQPSVTLDSSGNIYGTTYNGGDSNYGTVYKIAAGTNTIKILATFNEANGKYPNAGVKLDSDGNIYGTTAQGGDSNFGTVFKIAAGTNTFTTLVSFNSMNGAYPVAGVTLDNSGNLYGTTAGGGNSDRGTVYKIPLIGAVAAPEPSSLLLLAPGALGLIVVRRRTQRGADGRASV